MKTVDEKMNNIERKLKEQEPNVKNIEKKIVAFENEYEIKIKGLENQLTKMNNLMEKKISTISSLEKDFKDFEQRFDKQEKENDALKLKIENLQETSKEIKK